MAFAWVAVPKMAVKERLQRIVGYYVVLVALI